MSQRGRITAFSANDDKPLDLSNPPTGGTAVTKPDNSGGCYSLGVRHSKPPELSTTVDFDGAQARVINGVLYITWMAPNTGVANLTITPLSQIMQVDWTESEAGVVLYLQGHNPYVYCKKSRELAEFIGAHLEDANG